MTHFPGSLKTIFRRRIRSCGIAAFKTRLGPRTNHRKTGLFAKGYYREPTAATKRCTDGKNVLLIFAYFYRRMDTAVVDLITAQS